jgi:hypothetical protein
MTFFKWLFEKKTNTVASDSPTVSQELFVENTPPTAMAADAANEPSAEPLHTRDRRIMQRPTAVHNFLERDYWQLGYNHALQFPSKDRKQSALVRIKADYQQALNQAKQVLLVEKESHEQEMLRMGGISDILDAQLQRRNRELESLLGQITHQLELSVHDEGWLAPVVAAYNDGFLVGSMEYMRNNDLLGGVTGLQ